MKCIRTLARSQKYQSLYSQAKQLSHIRIFNNDNNFSNIQLEFLNWMEIYSQLLQEIALDKPYINYKIIDNDIDVDAYLYFKSQERKNKDTKKEKPIVNNTAIPTLINKK